MIRAALAKFIRESELGTTLGVKAYVMTPEFVVGEYPKPLATVTYLAHGQELWVVGDAQRHERPTLQVSFYLRDVEQRQQARQRFLRLIESAQALGALGTLIPGIDYIVAADLLRNSGDNLAYLSDQPNWFAVPAPRVFKNEDANGNPVEIFSGFTVDVTLGKVTFAVAQAPTDRIRATYKAGVIDFDVASVEEPQMVDLANNAHKHNVVFDLDTHFYIKTNANRYV